MDEVDVDRNLIRSMLTVTASNLARCDLCIAYSIQNNQQKEKPIVCKNKCRRARTPFARMHSSTSMCIVDVDEKIKKKYNKIVSVCVRVHFDGQESEIIEIYN